MAPDNIAFLEIMVEFSSKLLRQDRRVVLDYLKSRLNSVDASGNIWNSQDPAWVPLMAYKNSLQQAGFDDTRSGKKKMNFLHQIPAENNDGDFGVPPSPFLPGNNDDEMVASILNNDLGVPAAESTAVYHDG